MDPGPYLALQLLASLDEVRNHGRPDLGDASADSIAWLARRRIDSLWFLANGSGAETQRVYDAVWRAQRALLEEAVTSLRDRGVDAIVFKGAEFLLRYYGTSSVNLMHDVDVLVRHSSLAQARTALSEAGFVQGAFDAATKTIVPHPPERVAEIEAGHYELAPMARIDMLDLDPSDLPPEGPPGQWRVWAQGDGVAVALELDVHYDVALNIRGDRFFEVCVPSALGVGWAMNPTDRLWFSTSRYYSEVAMHGKRSLRDFAYLLPALGEPIDWESVLRAHRDYGLGASLYYYFAFMGGLGGATVPDDVLAELLPVKGERPGDWGWQLGPLFDLVEPFPLG